MTAALETTITLRAPYLIFLGDVEEPTFAKTGLGVAQWCPEQCVGQLRLPGANVDAKLPDMTVAQAAAAGAKSIIMGVAPVGGQFKDAWVEVLKDAALAGMDVVAGMHKKLAALPGLAEAAQKGGGRLVDVRVPPPGIPVGSGEKRKGLRLLTVGTDCAVGKKYTALAIASELKKRGKKASFRATGQTGIMIAGHGMPIDTVVCDFTAGAAEVLSPANDANHWDVIEGQGSLFHPAYAGVSLSLLHGSQPDAIVVCHEAKRKTHSGFPKYPLPTIRECIELNVQLARRTNPKARCVGVAINTTNLKKKERGPYLSKLAKQLKLPVVDPLVEGPGAIVDRLLKGKK